MACQFNFFFFVQLWVFAGLCLMDLTHIFGFEQLRVFVITGDEDQSQNLSSTAALFLKACLINKDTTVVLF